MPFKKNHPFTGIQITLFLTLCLITGSLAFTHPFSPKEAFGYPGTCPNWPASTLTFLGTAANPTSKVWFTGINGILGEIFYPSADKPATVDWQFLIGDANKTWVDEEKQDTTHQVRLNHPHSLAWNLTNTAKNNHYQIQKTIFTDPTRNSLIQQITFTALTGTLKDYNLYTLYHPAISNNGKATTGSHTTDNGKNILIAQNANSGETSALASSLNFQPQTISAGFVGYSDGWQDLKGGKIDNTLNWKFDTATNGNIAQIAQFDLSDYPHQKSITFHLVLGFGDSETSAKAAAAGTLGDNISTLLSTYNSQWNYYTDHLNSFDNTADQQYYLAAMVLKASQDKSSGAMVAGLGNPWGESNYSICTPFGVEMQGGYHLIWPRDLYKFASALIAAGDRETANSALNWLFNKSQQPDGHFLQNAFADGTPYWNSIQMDQTAFPIILAWKLGRNDPQTYLKHIKPAADFIVKNGPWTQQERWEENAGYSPATIAAEIAGLVCAADIAKLNGDTPTQQHYLATADYWQSLVETWTFTTTGSIGNGNYYQRIDDNGNPNDGHLLNISNGGGSYDERSIVDTSFLELVRHGVKAWNNPYILSSLPAIDSTIKQTLPNKGEAWFRYNHDGYGETAAGADYTGAGIGRLWPIFTGERGHYAIAGGEKADTYLATLRAFANDSYMIPEQVWDLNAPSQFTPGTPTKSMTPLSWSMGEYITLLASNHSGKVIDMPAIVHQRYVTNAYKPQQNYPVDYNKTAAAQGKALTIYYKGSLANASQVKLHWGYNNWQFITDKPMIKRTDGFWETTLSLPVTGTTLNFAFTDGKTWDNTGKNWNQTIATGTFQPINTPIDIWPNPVISGQPLKIYYKGSLAGAATAITLHWGHNGFKNPTDVPMKKEAGDYWTTTINLPETSTLNLTFLNQSQEWDNNNLNNYNYTTSQR
ncbi:glycoside hydrolase family 15 protein [Microcoleus sp. FACHB-68]|uniref:glycoside hydrolase family 15 protein n=1 Tax=Microcoleus sp. FACHB-68 TaxID=2692826 RepID=UPI001684053B|nr:glycoside hydrolase family 15 protein [Microcoleus sp. FACHB-68]MBD1937280.1 amylase [Microcoleus sp. FACHB-68]